MREPQKREQPTSNEDQGGGWRIVLGLGSAFLTQELGMEIGQHLNSSDVYPLSVAVGMSLYNYHIFKFRVPTDPRSRLRAIWTPTQKKQAIWVGLALLCLSTGFYYQRAQKTVQEVTFERIETLFPIRRGLSQLPHATPHIGAQPYRWVLNDQVEQEGAPHLTPVKEFNGQLLLVSNQPIQDSLVEPMGWLTELSAISRPHFAAYRNYMGLSSNAPIYLFDLRGVWWFDPYALAALLASFSLFWGILASATRDEYSKSRILFIPEELRHDLFEEDDEMKSPSDQSGDASEALDDSSGHELNTEDQRLLANESAEVKHASEGSVDEGIDDQETGAEDDGAAG